MNHPRSSWLWVPRDRLFHDMRNSTFDMRRSLAADLQEPALYTAVEFEC